jgi:electron transfer flavoprotein alpha subunit
LNEPGARSLSNLIRNEVAAVGELRHGASHPKSAQAIEKARRILQLHHADNADKAFALAIKCTAEQLGAVIGCKAALVSAINVWLSPIIPGHK